MKTKLLKKVRKRFSIEYYPNGGMIEGVEYSPIIVVRDLQRHEIIGKFYITFIDGKATHLETLKKQCYKKLCQVISITYYEYGTRRKKLKKIEDKKFLQEFEKEQKIKEEEASQSKITMWYNESNR